MILDEKNAEIKKAGPPERQNKQPFLGQSCPCKSEEEIGYEKNY
jgi:hypothetical protein